MGNIKKQPGDFSKSRPVKSIALKAIPPCDVREEGLFYGLPIAPEEESLLKEGEPPFDFLLVKSLEGWVLQDCHHGFAPWCIDFTSPTLQTRAQKASLSTEPLAKAVGLSPGKTLRILDATGGIGRDSFILATLGCEVTVLERSPVLAILLQEALLKVPHLPITFHFRDAVEYLKDANSLFFDVIYLDPLFPVSRKTALVKKEMQILHALIEPSPQEESLLLALAQEKALQRIVVKRPKQAPFLGKSSPHHSIFTKKYRFDVYSAKK